MNKDLKQRIIVQSEGRRFHTAVEVFGRHKKKAGKQGIMQRRAGFLAKIFGYDPNP